MPRLALLAVAALAACSVPAGSLPAAPSPALPDGVELLQAEACRLVVEPIAAPAGAGNRCWFHAADKPCTAFADAPTWSVEPEVYLEVLTQLKPSTTSEDGRGRWAYIAGKAGRYRVTARLGEREASVMAEIVDGGCATAPKLR